MIGLSDTFLRIFYLFSLSAIHELSCCQWSLITKGFSFAYSFPPFPIRFLHKTQKKKFFLHPFLVEMYASYAGVFSVLVLSLVTSITNCFCFTPSVKLVSRLRLVLIFLADFDVF